MARRHVANLLAIAGGPAGPAQRDGIVAGESYPACSALSALTDDQRHVVELIYGVGFSYLDVARQFEIPIGTVKSRLAAGMRRLRQSMSE